MSYVNVVMLTVLSDKLDSEVEREKHQVEDSD